MKRPSTQTISPSLSHLVYIVCRGFVGIAGEGYWWHKDRTGKSCLPHHRGPKKRDQSLGYSLGIHDPLCGSRGGDSVVSLEQVECRILAKRFVTNVTTACAYQPMDIYHVNYYLSCSPYRA